MTTAVPAPSRRARTAVGALVAAVCLLLAACGAGPMAEPDVDEPAGTGEVDDGSTAAGRPEDAGAPDPAEDRPDGADEDTPADEETEPQPGSEQAADGDAEDAEDAEADRERLVIQHVGDVNLDVSYVPVLGRDPSAAWDGVRDSFADAELAMVNLECAATDGGTPQDKQFVFRCSLDALSHMRDAGVDVATLANNHSGDLGIAAMVESVANVEAADIATVGVGSNEEEAYTPQIVEVAGWRIAILGFGGVVPVPEWTARGDQPGQATGYDATRMAEAVAAAAEDADLVVATVHWGNEGALEPRAEDVVKAEAMIEAGADVVFGHHAHRLQPLRLVDEVPVFWNLGNFVWPRHSPAGATTAVAEYVLDPDGTVTACLVPFEIDSEGVPRPTGEDRDCAEPTQLR